jgi:hypothetical protein
MLSFLLTKKNWYDFELSSVNLEIFTKAYNENFEILITNYAATLIWLDFWNRELNEMPLISYAIIFSGSLIYQKTLILICQKSRIKTFVIESSFTGSNYYIEHKYSHISNNSDIKFQSFYDSIKLPGDKLVYFRERNKAINKILLSKNKNVVQPIECEELDINPNLPTVLIIGQVVNDFSLIESNICSINFYKRLLQSLSNYDFNIVFKSHPWEEKKINIKKDLTNEEINSFIKLNLKKSRSRVNVTNHYPISRLYEISDFVISLSSQSLIEAAFYGHKPIQFGNAFYGGRGFTYDLSMEVIDEFCEKLNRGEIVSKMTLDEYDNYMCFITKFIHIHLISVHKSGIMQIRQLFEEYTPINIISEGIKPNKKKLTKQNPVRVDSEKISTIKLKVAKQEPFEKVESSNYRKFKKFKNNPYKFLYDALRNLARKY